MGIFNFFIVSPEIIASLGFGWVMTHLLDNNRLAAVVAGGVFFVVAAVLMQRVKDAAVVTPRVAATGVEASPLRERQHGAPLERGASVGVRPPLSSMAPPSTNRGTSAVRS
ncbi:MAG: hypothetical protein ABSH32_17140 [Bryobacteraceae bacterium]|jgi:hypothetical protein